MFETTLMKTFLLILFIYRATTTRPNGASKAVEYLYWMQDLHRHGDEAARLDVIKYTTCISALAKQGCPDQAEALLNKMRIDFVNGNDKAQPNAQIFEMVMQSWTNRVDRVEHLLRQMWTLHDTQLFDHIRPTGNTYRRVLAAMKHKPERAEALLWEMDRLYQSGKLNERPNKQVYQTVIHAWTNSNEKTRRVRAYQLQVKMEQLFPQRSQNDVY
jgi:pentatricopeptide repeat protein